MIAQSSRIEQSTFDKFTCYFVLKITKGQGFKDHLTSLVLGCYS